MSEQLRLPVMLNTKDVCDILRIDRTTLHNMEIRGRFPKPLRLGGANSAKRWRLTDVEAFINDGVQGSRTKS